MRSNKKGDPTSERPLKRTFYSAACQDWGCKLEALRVVAQLVASFSKPLAPHMSATLGACWTMFTTGLPIYQATLVLGDEESEAGEGGVGPGSGMRDLSEGSGGAVQQQDESGGEVTLENLLIQVRCFGVAECVLTLSHLCCLVLLGGCCCGYCLYLGGRPRFRKRRTAMGYQHFFRFPAGKYNTNEYVG